MKQVFLKISVFVIVITAMVLYHTGNASAVGKPFGGKIINTKAIEISSLENSNYKCIVPGSTITIKPVTSSSPSTFFIPAAVKSRTNTSPRAGQQIKGLYSQSKTTITCIFQGTPPSTTTTTLTPITLFGTSKY